MATKKAAAKKGAKKTISTRAAKATAVAAPPVGESVEVALDDILVVENVRKEFDPVALNELADSIRAQGVLQPILLRRVKGARYLYSIAPANDAKQLYQRLRLLDLSELSKRMLHEGKLPLGHALELAKVGTETQDEVLKEIIFEFGWDDKKNVPLDDDVSPLSEVKARIEASVYRNLDAAPWPKDWAPEGYPNGACSTCRFNTANDAVLFTKEKGSGRCTNGVSFEMKMGLWFAKRAKEIKDETGSEAVFVATSYYGPNEAKRRNLPKSTLSPDKWRALSRKEGACDSARKAVVVYGADRGHTKNVCADAACKVHFNRRGASLADASKSPKASEEEARKRNERKQELFNMRVAEPVRLEVFRRLKDKMEGGASFELRPVDRFYMNQIVMRLIQKTTYKTMKAVHAVLGDDAWKEALDAASWNPQKLVAKLEATAPPELFWIAFLISVAHFGENESMIGEVDQKTVVALAEQHEIPYAEIDAEERLKQSPRKYRELHEAHLALVREGKAGVKDAPKVYGDPPQKQRPLAPSLNEQQQAALRRATHHVQNAETRWDALISKGATDAEIKALLSREFGLGGMSSGPGDLPVSYKGGSDPRVWFKSTDQGKPSLRGVELVAAVRSLLQIPMPGEAVPKAEAAGGNGVALYAKGSKVRVTAGPFKNKTATVEEALFGGNTYRVKIGSKLHEIVRDNLKPVASTKAAGAVKGSKKKASGKSTAAKA